jgi:pyruvate dehydrogenase E1 component alpha subunit
MDFLSCYGGFHHIYEEVRKIGRPVLVEAVTERFRGHSISDPALYRSKEELEEAKSRDPLHLFADELKKRKVINDKDVTTLEEDVFAP